MDNLLFGYMGVGIRYMDPAAILGTRERPASGRRSILGWTLCHLCFSTLLCSCLSFGGGPPLYHLLWIWVYKNTITFGKVFQMLGELLQNNLVLQNDLIQNVANF